MLMVILNCSNNVRNDVDEQALQKEKEMVETRVNESRNKRVQDYVDVLPELPPTPGKPDNAAAPADIDERDSEEVGSDLTAAGVESAVSPESINSQNTVNSTASSSDDANCSTARRAPRRLVKTLSQKFDPAAMMSVAAASLSGNNNGVNK